MLRRYLAFILMFTLSQTLGALAVSAQPRAEAEAQAIEQIKSKVARIGIGEKARATVRLKNGQKLKGYIAQAREQDFVLRDRKTDAPTEIAYTEVAKVESNRGHSTARNLGIGIGVGAGAVLVTLALILAHLD